MVTELLFLLLAFTSSLPPAEEDTLGPKLAALEERFRGNLVQVRYRQRVSRSTAEPPEEEELTTTGIIVSPRGMVLVSAIVFEPFNSVPHGVGIRFPGSVSRAEAEIAHARIRTVSGDEFPASLLGRDSDADVAFFQIQAEGREFEPLLFQPAREVEVGEEVAVVSLLPEPIGPAVAVEVSRVQARTARPRAGFVVSTGASDPVGALVASFDGEVLGYLDALTITIPETSSKNPLALLTLMRELPKGIGRGFARPASELVDASVDRVAAAASRRGWLGIEMQALSKDLASHMELPVSSGVLVGYVYSGSPADRAGLRIGDVLVSFDGTPITVDRDEEIGSFAERILRAGPEATLELGYLRDGARMEARVELDSAPRSTREAQTLKVDELDLTVREITYDYLATRFLEPDHPGVVVVQPPVGVSSNQNRVAPGDLVVRVGDEPVSDFSHFRELVNRIREEKPQEVVLFVSRGRESFFFALKPDWN